MDAAGRFLAALGMTCDLTIRDLHLRDRERQVDVVHSVMNGFIARRLQRWSWLPVLEAQIGDLVPRGWIDLIAYREVDRSLLVEETKSDIPDMGGLQRSVSFYQSMAWEVARGLDWKPARIAVLVVALDSETVAGRLVGQPGGGAARLPRTRRRIRRVAVGPCEALPEALGVRDLRSGVARADLAASDDARRQAPAAGLPGLRRGGRETRPPRLSWRPPDALAPPASWRPRRAWRPRQAGAPGERVVTVEGSCSTSDRICGSTSSIG